MKDHERLINDGPTDFERLLVDGAANERPSPELGARMAAGLERVLDSRATPTATAWSVPWMWLGALALVGGGLSALGFVKLRHDAPAPAAAEIAAPVAPAPPALAMPDKAVTDLQGAEGVSPPAGALPDPGAQLEPHGSSAPGRAESKAHGTRAAKSVAAEAPIANAGGDLREEVRLIQRARAGVREHDGARALAELRDYAARFPNGTFAPEATVLGVEALDLDGQHAQAVAMGRRFLAAHPDSPFADRVERITGPSTSK